MPNPVIKAENLSKLYRLGEVGTGTLSHDLNRWWARIRGKEDPFAKVGQVNDRSSQAVKGEHVWALKDISFEVEQGEVLGIIGKNGAGKSTLLKILSRITSPTRGCIKAKGRIASLLEVGTGMHMEMTGRENIYMMGTIMGMTRAEISSKLDDIVDFAGCAKYLGTPVKRYSSGMKVRLGFAVAAFLEPEILVIDEVLAVGDAEFQKRAIGKMQDVSNKEGRTVLFVSHNMNSIEKLCNRCIMLKDGMLNHNSHDVNYVVSQHLSDSVSGGNSEVSLCEWSSSRFGKLNNSIHSITYIKLADSSEKPFHGIISNTKDINLYIEGELFKYDPSLNIGFAIYDAKNERILWSWVKDCNKDISFEGITAFNLKAEIPSHYLNEGEYSLEIFSVLHNIKALIKIGEGPRINFKIEGGNKNVKLSPKFHWELL